MFEFFKRKPKVETVSKVEHERVAKGLREQIEVIADLSRSREKRLCVELDLARAEAASNAADAAKYRRSVANLKQFRKAVDTPISRLSASQSLPARTARAERVEKECPMTPDHIVKDIGRKLADDVTAAAHRAMPLVDDQKSMFVVATYGASAAIAAATGAFCASHPGTPPEHALDVIWSIMRPIAMNAIESLPA